MQQAHDWVVKNYNALGAQARNEPYGEWRSWERGTSQVTMTYPRIKSLEGTQLAFSPMTKEKGIEAEVVAMPLFSSQSDFQSWLKTVKGKIVLIGMNPLSGRSDANWKESASPKGYEKYQTLKNDQLKKWEGSMSYTGSTRRTLPLALENAGAVGVIDSYWTELPSHGFLMRSPNRFRYLMSDWKIMVCYTAWQNMGSNLGYHYREIQRSLGYQKPIIVLRRSKEKKNRTNMLCFLHIWILGTALRVRQTMLPG